MTGHLVSFFSDQAREEGTSAGNVFALIVPFALFSVLVIIINVRLTGATKRFTSELILLVYTALCNVTILSDYISFVLIFMTVLIAILVPLEIIRWNNLRDIEQDPSGLPESFWVRMRLQAEQIEIPLLRPGYVTMFRSTVLLLTVICILAVDFPIFPQYSFKTHKYGFSLMDVGIGLFVCIIAVVSSKPPTGLYKSPRNLAGLIWNVTPLFILGIGRSVIIRLIHYHQGVTEYGEHWNAFLTLAFTKFFGTILASCVASLRHMLYLSVVMLCFHETGLQWGLAHYVMDRTIPRDNFFRANREGIISIPGFVALYLAIIYVGHLLHSSNGNQSAKDLSKRILRFLVLSSCLWITVFYMESTFGVSRRIVSAGYVMWILCIFTSMSIFFMMIELLGTLMARHKNKDCNWSYVPLIMQSINYNGLFFFLLANVLTGLVNMSIETRKVGWITSFLILMVYMFLNCFAITFFYVRKIKIKCW